MRILLVENDPRDAELEMQALDEEHGWQTVHVSTLAEARARLAKNHFNVVLLDLGLPDSTPEMTLSSIPELSTSNALAVLTGYEDPFLRALTCGADAYILKDKVSNHPEFVSLIRQALDSYVHRAALPPKIASSDPRDTLKSMKDTGRLPISELASDMASPAQAETLIAVTQGIKSIHLALQAQNVVLKDHGYQLTTGATMMKQIDTTTRETNGKAKILRKDTDALQLQVKALMDKDGERTALALNDAVRNQAVEAAHHGVWVMPKPTWKQLSFVGGVIVFMGIDRVLAVVHTLAGLLSKI